MKDKFILLAVIIIAAAGVIVYINSIDNPFIWDDHVMIKSNPNIRHLSGVVDIFTRDSGYNIKGGPFVLYRPAQMISYMTDYRLYRLNPRGYHVTNIILHIAMALGVFWLINLLFKDVLLSFGAALLFAVHPVHTEAVTYISGRADILAGLFMIISFISYIKYKTSKNIFYYAMMLALYILALFSKEYAVILPALFIMYCLVFKKEIRLKTIAPLFIIAFLFIALRLGVTGFLRENIPAVGAFWQRMPGFFVSITGYIRLLLWPVNLHMEYGNRLFSFSDPKAIAGVILLAAMVIFCILRRKSAAIVFSVSFFILAILPFSNIYPVNAYMAEHWLYLPSIGYFLLIVYALRSLSKIKGLTINAAGFFIGLVLVYASFTVSQNLHWKYPVNFYERTLTYAPDSVRLYNNLGSVYYEKGKFEEAVTAYKKALELNPSYYVAYNSLGAVYSAEKRCVDAVACYRKAIELNPAYANAYYNLGIVYSVTGDKDASVEAYRKAIELYPDYIEAYKNLGDIFVAMSRMDEAARVYERVLKVDPSLADVSNALGNIYSRMGKRDKAIALYKNAIRSDRSMVESYNNLGSEYAMSGKIKEAIKIFNKAIQINSNYPPTHMNLAIAYYNEKRYAEAFVSAVRAKELGFNVDAGFIEKLKSLAGQNI